MKSLSSNVVCRLARTLRFLPPSLISVSLTRIIHQEVEGMIEPPRDLLRL
jgi:hypothetical protein